MHSTSKCIEHRFQHQPYFCGEDICDFAAFKAGSSQGRLSLSFSTQQLVHALTKRCGARPSTSDTRRSHHQDQKGDGGSHGQLLLLSL